MKRSESDGTDLNINSKLIKNCFCTMLLSCCLMFSNVWANEINLYSSNEDSVLHGVFISNSNETYALTAIVLDELIEGIISTSNDSLIDSVNDGTGGSLDSVNDGTGGSLDSVNDGTGGSLDSVNDGTGGSLDSVNDGTGGSLDSVNDGTGGLNSNSSFVFSIQFSNCNEIILETDSGISVMKLNKLKINNNEVECN